MSRRQVLAAAAAGLGASVGAGASAGVATAGADTPDGGATVLAETWLGPRTVDLLVRSPGDGPGSAGTAAAGAAAVGRAASTAIYRCSGGHNPRGSGNTAAMATYAVAASGQWRGADGIRMPAGDVHAWFPGQNQTRCGLPLARTGLLRFPHVRWEYQRSDTLTAADRVGHICERCLGATNGRRGQHKNWVRTTPRP